MPIDITSREVNIYEVQNGGKISVDLTFNLSLEKISNIEKMQLFHVYDRDGEKIYFSGSNNATVSGLNKNWETVMLLASWWGDEEEILEQKKEIN